MVNPSVKAGQMRIPEIAEAVKPKYDLQRQETFSRVATPEFWDLDAGNYGEDIVTPKMRTAIRAEKFRPIILGVDRPKKNVVGGVAMTDGEYGLIIHSPSPSYFADRTESRSRRRNRQAPMDVQQSLAEEETLAALESRRTRIQHFIDATLVPREVLLEKVQEAASHPGLKRRRNLVSREEVGTVKDLVFTELLAVIRIQKKWSRLQYRQAERSLTYSLFFDRTHNRHFQNWNHWLQLARDHNSGKTGVFVNRAQNIAKEIKRRELKSQS